jgi:hypothetical protein
MDQKSIKITSALIPLFLIFSVNLFSQDLSKTLFISKISNPEKVRQIAKDTKIKIKTFDGRKIKSCDFISGEDFLIAEKNDTILFQNIYSFRTQRKLNKTEFFLGVPLLIIGTTAAVTGVPLSIMLIFMEEAGAGIFLIPVTGVISTVAGVKTVGRETYFTDEWKMYSN